MDLAKTIRAIYNCKILEFDSHLDDMQIVDIVINDFVAFNRLDISDTDLEEALRKCIC